MFKVKHESAKFIMHWTGDLSNEIIHPFFFGFQLQKQCIHSSYSVLPEL